jgi:hypothetical protein
MISFLPLARNDAGQRSRSVAWLMESFAGKRNLPLSVKRRLFAVFAHRVSDSDIRAPRRSGSNLPRQKLALLHWPL